MAITKVLSTTDNLKAIVIGAEVALGTIVGPASYATGGFAADVETDLELGGAPDAVFVSASNGMTCTWVGGSTKKIKVFGSLASDAATELTAAEDLSAVTFTVLAFRKAA